MKKLKNNQGFTIIEVMIVLVIAAVILLIVFLAVPALQRNARNTQYRSEAAQLLAAANEFSNNNNGAVPGVSPRDPVADATAIWALTKNKNILSITVKAEGTATAVPTTDPFSSAVLVTGAKCNASDTINFTDSQSPRGIALVYQVEDGTGAAVRACTDS